MNKASKLDVAGHQPVVAVLQVLQSRTTSVNAAAGSILLDRQITDTVVFYPMMFEAIIGTCNDLSTHVSQSFGMHAFTATMPGYQCHVSCPLQWCLAT